MHFCGLAFSVTGLLRNVVLTPMVGGHSSPRAQFAHDLLPAVERWAAHHTGLPRCFMDVKDALDLGRKVSSFGGLERLTLTGSATVHKRSRFEPGQLPRNLD